MGPTEKIIKNPKHPYTQALITVVPKPDPTAKEEKIILKGERPDPTNIPKGCRFHPRCPYVMEICEHEQPAETEVEAGHWAECFLLTPEIVDKWNKEWAVKKEEEKMKKITAPITPKDKEKKKK
ncbi:MAG: ABC transporter ATP-binding protein [Thermoplasmata archaeon]|nr:ABC transporter ATP-binding protein [Thermoplasmata archaeon]